MPDFEEILKTVVPVLPPGWPGQKLEPSPSDLSTFASQGFGLGAPLVMRPWDRLEDLGQRRDYYGFDAPAPDPVKTAPATESRGGVLYFDDDVEAAALDSAMGIMGVQTELNEFATFASSAKNTPLERFLDQIRIVSLAAVQGLFRIPAEVPIPRPPQPVTVGQLVHRFIDLQKERWGRGFSPELAGSLDGDGDWAKESLAFGLMVENTYWGIYRVWSRPWLVTK